MSHQQSAIGDISPQPRSTEIVEAELANKMKDDKELAIALKAMDDLEKAVEAAIVDDVVSPSYEPVKVNTNADKPASTNTTKAATAHGVFADDAPTPVSLERGDTEPPSTEELPAKTTESATKPAHVQSNSISRPSGQHMRGCPLLNLAPCHHGCYVRTHACWKCPLAFLRKKKYLQGLGV